MYMKPGKFSPNAQKALREFSKAGGAGQSGAQYSSGYAVVAPLSPANPAGTLSAADERELISRRVLLDLSRQKYPADRHEAVAAVKKTLLKRTGLDDIVIVNRLLEELGAPLLDEIAESVVDLRSLCVEPVDLALTGKLRSAVLAAPTLAPSRDGRDAAPGAEYLDLIEHLGLYHQMRWLVAANKRALMRCFHPTGIEVLDGSGVLRATRAKTAAGVLAYNADWMVPIIELIQVYKESSIPAAVEQQIKEVPGLLTHAQDVEAKLRELFGDDLPTVVAELGEFACFYAPRIQREIRSFAATLHANKTLYGFQNTEPLIRLYLTAMIAHGWINNDRGSKSPLRQALDDIRAGGRAQEPALGKKMSSGALRLFYVVRNFRCCDETTRATASRDERLEVIMRSYDEKLERNGYEEFACDFSTRAYAAYRMAVGNQDVAFVSEVHGWLPTLLGV